MIFAEREIVFKRNLQWYFRAIKKYGIKYIFFPSYYNEKIRRKAVRSSFERNKKVIKANLVSRFGNKCSVCEGVFPEKEMTINHIKPIRDGGSNYIANLELTCFACNQMLDVMDVEKLPPINTYEITI